VNYQAIVAPITNIRNHPNADRLNLGTAAGFQVVISKDMEENTLGIFFPSDGQLSFEMCRENNLHRHVELNIDPKAKAGFFDDNRRIRAQKLRGEISEGFWVELDVLKWTGISIDKLKSGNLIDELNSKPICNKYYTPATMRMMGQGKGKNSKRGFRPESFPYFKEHWHTNKLRMMIGHISEGAILSISEKVHGTSARTGRMIQRKKLNWSKRLWNNTIGKLGLQFNDETWRYVSGSRKVVLDPKKTEELGFYSGKKFRSIIHQKISNTGLHKGETIFYEIVGYDDTGGLIMKAHTLTDKEMIQHYGNRMPYTYGCQSEECKVLVYRITQASSDGCITELSWNQMTNRCNQLGFEPVPQLAKPFIYDGYRMKLFEFCEELSQGNSTLDDSHIREGVVVRVEDIGIDTHYKYKSYWFADLEGIQKNSDDYVDIEEIS